MAVHCHRVPDRLEAYHPFTVAYRQPDSTLYRTFSPHDPRDPDAVVDAARALSWDGDRTGLAAAVTACLQRRDAPAPAGDAARTLADAGTVAVVTGHQPVLFGGPLHVAWKAMSTIRICTDLNERQSGIRFVPVFWNGSEDHNLDEFGVCTLLDRQHDLVHLAMDPSGDARMAAATPAETALDTLGDAADALPETEFHPDLFRDLHEMYRRGSLGEAFSRLLLQWFGEAGLVVLEPHLLRDAMADVLQQAVHGHEAVRDALATGSDAMAADGCTPPLPVPESGRTLVYHLDRNGVRRRIRASAEGGTYVTEGGDARWARDELADAIRDDPQAFSPAAALRPVAQGAALPVVAYVAGGGELAYHAQLPKLFAEFETPMPMLIPRAAGTIVKASVRKVAKKLDLEDRDLLAPGWGWETVAARASAQGEARRDAFERFREALDGAFSTLADGLTQAGTENLNELKRERKRFLDRVEGLEKRFESQDPAVGDAAKRQYWKLRKFVLPAERYQELSVWTLYFLCFFGPELLNELLTSIDPWSPEHHVFSVE